MFEKYMILPEMAKNTEKGFQFGARLPYYRGISLSMVEEIVVSIDGETVPKNEVLLEVDGRKYNLEERQNASENRWEMGEVAIISVNKLGGISKGEHTLGLLFNLRIGYMPFPSIRKSETKIIIK
jgi:Domain of unknown function (DUF6379)